MFRFPYRQLQPEPVPVIASAPPTLLSRLVQLITGKRAPARGSPPSASPVAARPFVSIRIRGPVAARRLKYALLDTGSQDTLLPLELAERLGVIPGGEKQTIKWRGQRHWVEFHVVELELTHNETAWRWRTRAGFTAAPLSSALLGQRGCLEFLDATFRGADQTAELEMNRLFPGTATPAMDA